MTDIPKTPDLSNILGPAPEPVTMRRFDDAPAIRKNIFDYVLKAAQTAYPIENSRHRLELQNLRYKDPKDFSIADHKKALLEGGTLEHKLHGDWVLFDKVTNQEMERKPGVVAHVPYYTNRGVFVFGGNEMQMAHQPRLRAGAYARRKDSGEIESHVNVRPGTGPSFRVHLEPETGVFRLGVGQSNLKLYPILRSMGVDDAQLQKLWGHELLKKNMEADDPRAVQRAFMRLVNTRELHGPAEQAKAAPDGPSDKEV